MTVAPRAKLCKADKGCQLALYDARKMLKPPAFIPSQTDLDAVKPGDYVKIAHNGERFWCKIVMRLPEGGFRVVVDDNKLIMKHPFRPGDIIEIRDRHIYDVIKQ